MSVDPARTLVWSGALVFCALFWTAVGYGLAALFGT